MATVWIAGTALLAYLAGAVPFGYLVARARGVDIVRHGSGNIGATNVGRVLGRPLGVLVFALDFAKGALPVALAGLAAPHAGDLPATLLPVVAGVAAFLGHVFPVTLGFRGGKGVATGAGVVAVLVPLPALAAAAAWVIVVCASRFVSLASVLAGLTLCVARLALTPRPWAWPEALVTGFCVAAVGLVVVRHRANLARLVRGTENALRERPAMLLLSKLVHVLAAGLWFGLVVFFTVVGLSLFGTMEELSQRPPAERPSWFPAWNSRDREPFPDAVSPKLRAELPKEQGRRAAGRVIAPLFGWYYGLQAACAAVCLGTSVGWLARPGAERFERLRALVFLLAAVAVGAGWWMEAVVSGERGPRDQWTDAVMASDAPTPEVVKQAEVARATFGMLHGISLLLSFVTTGLALVGLAMCVRLPRGRAEERALAPVAPPGRKEVAPV